jgi:hypothetical protein
MKGMRKPCCRMKNPSTIEGNKWTCHLKNFQKIEKYYLKDIFHSSIVPMLHTPLLVYESIKELTFIPSSNFNPYSTCLQVARYKQKYKCYNHNLATLPPWHKIWWSSMKIKKL